MSIDQAIHTDLEFFRNKVKNNPDDQTAVRQLELLEQACRIATQPNQYLLMN